MQKESRIFSIETSAAAICFILLAGSVFIQVLARFGAWLGDSFVISLPWTEELARFSFAWLLMLGASAGMAKQQHFALTMITDIFPQRYQPVIQIFIYLLELVFIGFLITYGFQLSRMAWGQISPALKIRYTYVYASIPLGALLMGIHITQSLIADIREFKGYGGK